MGKMIMWKENRQLSGHNPLEFLKVDRVQLFRSHEPARLWSIHLNYAKSDDYLLPEFAQSYVFLIWILFFYHYIVEVLSLGNCNTLNAHKMILLRDLTNFQGKLNGFLNTFHKFVKRPSLSMATMQGGYGRHIIAFGITFNNDIKFMFHYNSSFYI